MKFEQELRSLPDVLARPGEPGSGRKSSTSAAVKRSPSREVRISWVLETRGEQDSGQDQQQDNRSRIEDGSGHRLAAQSGEGRPQSRNSAQGTILFDRDAGHVVSAKGKIQIKGDMMTFSFNGTELPGALDLTMETDTELQPPAK